MFMCVCSTFRSSDFLLFVKNGFEERGRMENRREGGREGEREGRVGVGSNERA